jgi:hypothetical protein
MTDSSSGRMQAVREAFAWLTFTVFIVTSMGYGSVFAFRIVPLHLGIDLERQLVGWDILWLVIIAVLVIAFLMCLAATAWLLFAKFIFTRNEVSKVVFYGPTIRFERWLFDALFPPTS